MSFPTQACSYGTQKTEQPILDLAISYAMLTMIRIYAYLSKDRKRAVRKRAHTLWRKREGCDLKDRADGDCEFVSLRPSTSATSATSSML